MGRSVPAILTATLLLGIASFGNGRGANAEEPPKMQTVQGKHIALKSDGGTMESLQELVQAFDTAVPQWERFLELPAGTLALWKVDAFVMDQPDRFRDSGDLPEGLEFPFGFAMPDRIWVMRQQSDYYTRHLLLHEGVHALAINQFGSTGPSWFAEGLAEMLGVHQGVGNTVEVNVVPQSRNAVPFWGRFKMLSQRRAENRIPTIDAVLQYPQDLKSDVEAYGWSWVALMLLTQYPEYRVATLAEAKTPSIQTAGFSAALKRRLTGDWPIVQARWRMLVNTIDYGFDWQREHIELSIKDPVWNGRPIQTLIKADQGWQSIGVRFAPGMRVKISAHGRCTINNDPKPWVSEPPGVTIHYAGDRPLGQLLVCILPNRTQEGQLLEPLSIQTIESATEIVVDQHCWLLFRINDHLDDLGNNQGGYTVSIQR